MDGVDENRKTAMQLTEELWKLRDNPQRKAERMGRIMAIINSVKPVISEIEVSVENKYEGLNWPAFAGRFRIRIR